MSRTNYLHKLMQRAIVMFVPTNHITTQGLRAGKETTMASITFAASVSGTDADDAIARVAKHAVKCDGLTITGRVAERSARHMLWNVELAYTGDNANDVWVVLTSYGICPSDALGATWQQVAGVGC